MGRRGSIRLAEVFGIRIGVNASWFVVLFFFIFWLSGTYRATLETSAAVAYATAVASALLFFCSVVLHELGHALVARRQGIEIAGIDLWFFGGVARLREADSARVELRIAAAGPLVTLAVAVACTVAGILVAGPGGFWDGVRLMNGTAPLTLLLAWLASINAAVLLFNLVPAFPLDGARIVRAVAWTLTGDRARATRATGRLGQGFAFLLGGAGLALLVSARSFYGLYLMLLAFMLSQAARAAVAQSAFTARLDGLRIADIMDTEPVSVPAELPVDRALDEYFLRYGWPWFPVIDEDGRFIGLVRREPVEDAVHGEGAGARVAAVMEADRDDWEIGEEQPLHAVLGLERLWRRGTLMAVDGQGILRGVVTTDQVQRAIQAAAGSPAA